jgi:hypothetical protein
MDPNGSNTKAIQLFTIVTSPKFVSIIKKTDGGGRFFQNVLTHVPNYTPDNRNPYTI